LNVKDGTPEGCKESHYSGNADDYEIGMREYNDRAVIGVLKITGLCPLSVEKKLVAYHLHRLKDRDPQVRVASVHELEELGDAEVLSALRHLFENDPSVEVRKAAQSAGRKLYLKKRE